MQIWRVVVGFPDYLVSDRGNLKTRLKRHGGVSKEWRPLQPHVYEQPGYAQVCLRRDGKSYNRYVHRLVLEAFVGPCPPGMVARHYPDRTKTNNELWNLSWATEKRNADDRKEHGTHPSGSRNPMAKLTDEQVQAVRELRLAGLSCDQIAKQCKISQSHVSFLTRGKRRRVDGGDYSVPDLRRKLTDKELGEIRLLYLLTNTTQQEIARAYGVSASAISMICSGKRRKVG